MRTLSIRPRLSVFCLSALHKVLQKVMFTVLLCEMVLMFPSLKLAPPATFKFWRAGKTWSNSVGILFKCTLFMQQLLWARETPCPLMKTESTQSVASSTPANSGLTHSTKIRTRGVAPWPCSSLQTMTRPFTPQPLGHLQIMFWSEESGFVQIGHIGS